MNQIPNTYNPQQVPQPPIPRGQIRMNALNAVNKAAIVKTIYPKWLMQYSVVVYIAALLTVSFIYSSYGLPWYYMTTGVVAVVVFFLFGSSFAKNNAIDKVHKEKLFEKKIFLISIVPRLITVYVIYWVFQANYGDAFGFESVDAVYYDELGGFVAQLIQNGNYHFYDEIAKWSGNPDISDMGYGVYVGFVYWLTGSGNVLNTQMLGDTQFATNMSILALRSLKCVLSSFTAVLIYRLAKRNFGEQTGRIAAIFVALWPNFWYYCSAHLKETEMVFLAALFVEQADQMLRSRNFSAWKVIPVLLIAAFIFTFRTPLGFVALLALVFSVVMSSSKVVTWGKRIIVGGLALMLIGVTVGDRLQERAGGLISQVQGNYQKGNMEWRSERKEGNMFAKYASSTVFAPLIFTLPFPTMTRPYDGQEVQQLNHGGNFIKNIMSCFTIFALVMLLFSGKWREHLLPLSFMIGYLVVLAMSAFAQAERFHQPVMPFEFMFAAYGLSVAVTKKKYKRWFTYWCALMLVAAIAWNWFKLAGRGLV